MKTKQSLLTALLLLTITFSNAQSNSDDSKFALGFSAGLNRGIGFQVNVTSLQPLESIPVQLRFGIGYTRLNPGNSADARRIFINNATNGVPEKKGKLFDYRLDFMLNSNFIESESSQIVFSYIDTQVLRVILNTLVETKILMLPPSNSV